PVAPPSPDYLPGPEYPPSPDYVPDPEQQPSPIEILYVPEPEYPKYLAPFDDEAPLEDQPLPADASPIAASPDYVALLSPPLLVPSLPLPLPSPLTTSLNDTRAPLGYRATEIRMRALLPSTSRKTDIPEADMPTQKKACLNALAPGFEIGESSIAGAARQPGPIEYDLRRCRVEHAGYGITDTWDEIVDKMMEIAPTTLEGVNERVTELDTIVRQRTDEFETQLTTALGRVEVLEARDPEPQEVPAEAGSSCVTTALAERDTDRSRNGDNINDLGTGGRRQMTTPRECSYTDFLKWKHPNMVELSHEGCWTRCCLCNAMGILERMITDKYCPRELALMCDRMFPEESTKVERYIGGLPDMIHGSVKASKPQSMQEAIKFATEMMDKKMLTHAERPTRECVHKKG
nr:hypothetical protein [Tanacetum cinerariifolium]